MLDLKAELEQLRVPLRRKVETAKHQGHLRGIEESMTFFSELLEMCLEDFQNRWGILRHGLIY